MKRMHVHVGVGDVAQSVKFYSTMFGAEPTVLKSDYAKWMLDDPRVNFAISSNGAAPGLDHLGMQAETTEELQEIAGRLESAETPILEQKNTVCCYARGDKAWVTDPQGIRWESFYTFGTATVYGEAGAVKSATEVKPLPVIAPACCAKAS
jgi:hypothetical protein